MLKLRLFRTGCHKNPSFRIVVSDSKTKPNGSYIELIGLYDPNLGTHKLNEYSCLKWLFHGAQPTDTVKSFLIEAKIWQKYAELKQKKLLEQYLIDNAPVKPKPEQPIKKPKPKIKVEQPKVVKHETKKEEKVEKIEKPIVKEKLKEAKPEEKAPKQEATLKINKASKLFAKLSEEELHKRQTQKFEVTNELSSTEAPSTIIISLDKEQIENIINNEKEVIYFKRLPAHNFNRVLVYSKKPIGSVVGEFEVEENHTLKKTPAWKNYGAKSIFAKKEFDEYFADQDDAKLMIIKGFILYSNPRKLSDFKLTKGPSGFSYLK